MLIWDVINADRDMFHSLPVGSYALLRIVVITLISYPDITELDVLAVVEINGKIQLTDGVIRVQFDTMLLKIVECAKNQNFNSLIQNVL